VILIEKLVPDRTRRLRPATQTMQKSRQHSLRLALGLSTIVLAAGGALHQGLCLSQRFIPNTFRDAEQGQPGFRVEIVGTRLCVIESGPMDGGPWQFNPDRFFPGFGRNLFQLGLLQISDPQRVAFDQQAPL
jgi:hypothetical protein